MSEHTPTIRLESWPPGHVPSGPPYNLGVKVGDEWFALGVIGTTNFGGPGTEDRRAAYMAAVEETARLLLAAPKLLAALEAVDVWAREGEDVGEATCGLCLPDSMEPPAPGSGHRFGCPMVNVREALKEAKGES